MLLFAPWGPPLAHPPKDISCPGLLTVVLLCCNSGRLTDSQLIAGSSCDNTIIALGSLVLIPCSLPFLLTCSHQLTPYLYAQLLQVLLPSPALASTGDVVEIRTEARSAATCPSYLFSATLLRNPRMLPRSVETAIPIGRAEEGGLVRWQRLSLGQVELGFDDVYPDFDN